MHFGTKSYLKSNRNHTAKYSLREEGDKGELNNQDTIICYKYKKPDRVKYMIVQIYIKKRHQLGMTKMIVQPLRMMMMMMMMIWNSRN
jgi:hypothetical protein